MNGVDSLGSNQECGIGYKYSHSRVSQCLASIRKLGNRRRSEGLRSFKPSKETNLFILIILAGDFEMNPGLRFQILFCLFEIRKIVVCFLWLSLPGDYRVTDEALLAETT